MNRYEFNVHTYGAHVTKVTNLTFLIAVDFVPSHTNNRFNKHETHVQISRDSVNTLTKNSVHKICTFLNLKVICTKRKTEKKY